MTFHVAPMLADPEALIEAALPLIRDADARPHNAAELEHEAWVACRADLAGNNGFDLDVAAAVAEMAVAAAWMILAAEQARTDART